MKRASAVSICLLLPSLGLAQNACPSDPRVMQCWNTGGCDLEGRREFVQLLRDHDDLLLENSPDLTPEERAWYAAETSSRDAGRLRAAFESEIGSRQSVRGALAQRRGILRTLDAILVRLIDPPEGQPAIDPDEARKNLTGNWLLLAQAYSSPDWILAWDRLRGLQASADDENPEIGLQLDLTNCSMTVQAVLQIVYDDLHGAG